MRHLRCGKVSAALKSWEGALGIDETNETALSYLDYIKKNRIRIAVHLGRHSPEEGQKIDFPEEWPTPPAGLCDPVPTVGDDAGEARDGAQAAAAASDDGEGAASTDDTPYVEMEITGTQRAISRKAPKKPRPATDEAEAESAAISEPQLRTQAATSDTAPTAEAARVGSDAAYAAMEILVDEEPSADPADLPPPPEALDAPEMPLAAPKEAVAVEEPRDDVVFRTTSEQLEPQAIERLAGALDQELLDEDDEAEESAPKAPDDEATPARGGTPLPPSAPAQRASPRSPILGAKASITFDEAATNPRAQAEMMMRRLAGRNISPSTTLAGVGPKMLFADFKDSDLAGDAPSLDFGTPPEEEDAELAAVDKDERTEASARPETQAGGRPPPDETLPEQSSFREDARPGAASDAAPPVIRSDDPSDFAQSQDAFSDDIPTRARAGTPAEPRIRPMPLSDVPRTESSSPEDLVIPERPKDASRPAEVSEELEAILHPERGLALARHLCDTGDFDRSMRLAEQLQSRYPDLTGLADLIDTNRRVLEQKLLDSLGNLDMIAVPKPAEADLSAMDLDPRTAFLFSRIDGTMTVEDLIDISGMTRFETARILVRLKELGLLELEPS
ncbi:MAG: hypothetical protein ABI333_18875 [bacterium]